MMRRATDNRGSALVLALAVLGLVVAFGFAMYNASALDRLDLIDEYRFLVHPRIAGHGPTLFGEGLIRTRRLELVSSEALAMGAVAVHYRRARD